MGKLLFGLCVVVVACSGGSGSGSNPPTCEASCPMAVSAGCPNGPPSQADCLQGCQAIVAAGCTPQYDALARCGPSPPTYACDTLGRVIVVGCQAEIDALYTCLAGP